MNPFLASLLEVTTQAIVQTTLPLLTAALEQAIANAFKAHALVHGTPQVVPVELPKVA